MSSDHGASHENRYQKPFEHDYFQVDETTFEELLAMSAEFASKLHYVNLANQQQGNWADLFTSDETVILAMILATDLERLERDFLHYCDCTPEDMARQVYVLARRIDFWYRKLRKSDSRAGITFSHKIGRLISKKLRADLHTFGHFITLLKKGDQHSLVDSFDNFQPAWGVKIGTDTISFPQARALRINDSEDARDFLRDTFYSFFHGVSYLRGMAKPILATSLKSQEHNPAIGLFISFIRLYLKARSPLNSFSSKHLFFYYDQVLQIQPQGPEPDRAVLLFEPAEQGPVRIPKGHEFSAGKDDSGKTMIYRVENEHLISEARVEELAFLALVRDRLISPERELNFIARTTCDRVKLTTSPSEDTTLPPRPLFGVPSNDNAKTNDQARFGCGVADPALYLKEGWRSVELRFYCSFDGEAGHEDVVHEILQAEDQQQFFAAFGRLFSRYLLASEQLLSQADKEMVLNKGGTLISEISLELISDLLTRDKLDIYQTLMSTIFSVSLTSDQGWFDVQEYLLSPLPVNEDLEQHGLVLRFDLGTEDPAIVGYDPELHEGDSLETALPLVRLFINHQANFSSLSLFGELVIDHLEISTDVKGVKEILAYNNHGQLDPSQPFQPFGPLPSLNSYLILGNYEMARKKITALTLDLQWGDLPLENGGFAEHYKEYATDVETSSYTVCFSVLRDSQWKEEADQTSACAPLFRTMDNQDRISPYATLGVTGVNYCKPLSGTLSEENYHYGLKARNGFLRMDLKSPAEGFGHRLYPELLSAALAANSKLKHPQALPKAPYTPLLNRLTINYRAASQVSSKENRTEGDEHYRSKIFHFHPFGVKEVGATPEPSSLFPTYDHDGNLFIGFSAAKPSGLLTLWFNLMQDSVNSVAGQRPAIFWYALTASGWQPLDPARILSDTTEGFLRSGIIALDLPKEMEDVTSLMPTGLYWLRVAADQGLDSFCSLFSVRSQAVQVVWEDRGNSRTHLHTGLPPGSITSAVKAIAGLTGICQPAPSFGGRPPENQERLRLRISERLRHKNRASTAWDYERLILERFPWISMVKCFQCRSSSRGNTPHPGHLLIAVVPDRQAVEHRELTPMLNVNQLNEVRKYVSQLAPAYAHIEVRNPLYERIQIRLSVKFKTRGQEGLLAGNLNRAISEYISPWHGTGYSMKFGWCMKRTDIESFLRDLDYVEFVSDFSMLHITADSNQNYKLGDTARNWPLHSDRESSAEPQPRILDQIVPSLPWGLAIPAASHYIETIDQVRHIPAKPTGIDELEIGSTFIISGT